MMHPPGPAGGCDRTGLSASTSGAGPRGRAARRGSRPVSLRKAPRAGIRGMPRSALGPLVVGPARVLSPSSMARSARRSGNLPAEATSFIGRRRELAEVRKRLAAARLVSLVGPGGVGKTRLAIRAATDLGRGFGDGAWLAELAEISDPDLVDGAVLDALDLRDQAATEPLALLLSYL